MTDINLTVQHDGSLRPTLPADLDIIRKYKPGMNIRAKVSRPRNIDHHKKYWALLQAVTDHTSFSSPEKLLKKIKYDLGMYTRIGTTKAGEIFVEWESISFAKMDQNAFDDFYKRSVDLILQEILPGWTTDDIDKALEDVRAFA